MKAQVKPVSIFLKLPKILLKLTVNIYIWNRMSTINFSNQNVKQQQMWHDRMDLYKQTCYTEKLYAEIFNHRNNK